MGYEPFPYVGGIGPRNEIEQNVDEGALDENVVTIEPHNEMAYFQRFPKVFSTVYLALYRFKFRGGLLPEISQWLTPRDFERCLPLCT